MCSARTLTQIFCKEFKYPAQVPVKIIYGGIALISRSDKVIGINIIVLQVPSRGIVKLTISLFGAAKHTRSFPPASHLCWSSWST